MGLIGSLVAVLFRAVSLVGFAALYVYVAPWHLPADAWWTWVLLILSVDLLWYCYHRMSHRVRVVLGRAHQAHHSSQYFNYSTALRQKWNLWFEKPHVAAAAAARHAAGCWSTPVSRST